MDAAAVACPLASTASFVSLPSVRAGEVVATSACVSGDSWIRCDSSTQSVLFSSELDNSAIDVYMLSQRHAVYQATPGQHYLVLDCGAGANLAGEITLQKLERDVLDGIGASISYGANPQDFSGISQ